MDVADKIALYALRALEPDETREFEKLVAASPDLQRRVSEERSLISSLALAPDAITPSPALRQRLMTRIDAEAAPLASRLDAAARARPAARRSSGGLLDLLRGLTGAFAGVAALAAIALGVTLWQTQSQLAATQRELTTARDSAAMRAAEVEQLRTDNAGLKAQIADVQNAQDALNAQISDAKTKLDAAQAQLATKQTEVSTVKTEADKATAALKAAQDDLATFQQELAILSAPDVRIATLPSAKPDIGTGSVRVYYSPAKKQGIVAVSDLPTLPGDLCYQLWLIKGSDKLPSVVIKTDATGSGRTIVPSDYAFGEYELFGVTVEKAGGNPTPNPDGPVYLGEAATS